ncbi:MAG: OmpA family protein [Saprospiraceae bacterium]|nr:OmpA family protein [Saprospiraceae bacterium]MCF8248262.1 OmpA family protein [Saprospiraceae bacterium]MCF8279984.1 OmpA family protein [Bacteroidales bacterium]MCF8309790.1 OmpA family protein [Saprospiraceae bacterium]MCF8438879.1 OmpA family protein [Saprospiraceae bacterium]
MKNIKPFLLLLAFALSSQLMAQQGIELKNITEINGTELDFSPIPYGNGLIFTSSKSNRFLKCPAQNAGDYTDVKYAEKKADGTFGKPVSLTGNVNGKYNDGSCAMNPAGNKMVFTRNNLGGKNSDDVIDLKLYSADLDGDKWVNVTELPFDSSAWSTCHPALSNDGNLLIFSSNRPGSTDNSMDLYWSKLDGGVWSLPTNLGTGVNTGANELFPYLDENNNLFFSSDRAGGAGSLDIWAAAMNAGGQWEMIGNLGAPFNQSGDDVNFAPMNGGTEGYFASDRAHKDAQGRDDIYYWTYSPEKPCGGEVILAVEDKVTKKRLLGASIELVPTEFANMLDKIYSGLTASKNMLTPEENGEFKIEVREGMKYSLVTTMTDYKSDKREVLGEEIAANNCLYPIALEPDKCYCKLSLRIVEDPSGERIPMANIKVLDKTTGTTVPLTSDSNGDAFIAQIDCDHEFEVTASKSSYITKSISLKNLKEDCKAYNGIPPPYEVPLPPLKVVVLEPIFYDFDRYNIRERDAQPTLDDLAKIMNQYPSLVVRLGGNTDSRGPSKYNDRLATNRVNSAKSYLVEKKKVDKNRILTEQFGETKPVNKCSDEVYCPETDHQLNRRVDVAAESHNEPGVEFRTRPANEMKVESDRKDRKPKSY